jgi:hypothetical protein
MNSKLPGARVFIFAFLLLLACLFPFLPRTGLTGTGTDFEPFAVAKANEAHVAVRESIVNAMSRLARVDAARVKGVGVVLTPWQP